MSARIFDRVVSGLLLLASIGAAVLEAGGTRPQLDDAYISFRYAANLLAGHGLVYNPGEYVEGITNLLWTLLVAGGLTLGFEANDVGHFLGVASGVAGLIACWVYALAFLRPGRRWLAGLAPWVVLASTSFPVWSTSGMETMLYFACTVAALAAFAWDRVGWTTLFLALATLTRPDGGLTAAVVFSVYLVQHRHELLLDRQQTWRLLRAPLAFAAVVAAVTVFRLAYYGSPIPNTFYAKVGGIPIVRGWRQLTDFLGTGAFSLLLPAAVAMFSNRRAVAGTAVGVASAGYVVSVGGDVFPDFRFFMPHLGILGALSVAGVASGYRIHPVLGCVLGGALLGSLELQLFGGFPFSATLAAGAGLAIPLVWASLWKRRGFAVGALAGGAAFALTAPMILQPSQLTQTLAIPEPLRVEALQTRRSALVRFEQVGRNRGDLLRRYLPPVKLVATGAIGSFGFYSQLPVLDIHGLVDPTIARTPVPARHMGRAFPGHQRSNADYVLSRRPDYIIIPRPGSKGLRMPAVRDLWDHPDLDRLYLWDSGAEAYRLRTRAAASIRPGLSTRLGVNAKG